MSSLHAVLALLPFFALGMFPSGKLIAGYFGVDITIVGSGNVGATNVARIIGKRAGILTLASDLLKGFIATAFALWFGNLEFASWAALAAVLGHCFPIWPLRGGRGVATILGSFLPFSPAVCGISVLTFLAVFSAKRIVSLASVIAILLAPLFFLLLRGPSPTFLPFSIACLVVTYRHRENLERLSLGTEKKFSLSRQEIEKLE